MRRSISYVGLPLSMAAALAMVAGPGSAFAATKSHVAVAGHVESVNRTHAKVKIDGRLFSVVPGLEGLLNRLENDVRVVLQLNGHGKVIGIDSAKHMGHLENASLTAISSTSLTLGTTTYNLVAGAPIHYNGYILTAAQVPLNVQATVELDSAGAVEAVWLHSDANLPPSPVASGTVTAVTTDSITVAGYPLQVASNVVVRANGQTVPYSDIAVNQKVVVHLDQEGTVDWIQLAGQGTIQGSVTADSTSSIEIGSTTYPYASTVTIRYRNYTLTPSEIPTGSTAIVRLNALGQVTAVMLKSDSALPQRGEVSGTISAVSGNTITLNGYTLTMAPSFDLTFEGATALTGTVAANETASAWINASGQVSRLVVMESAATNN